MKLTTLLASAALAVSVHSAALADILPTDFSGSNVNMGSVHVGQFGTITNLYQSLFTVPPNTVGTGHIFGFLPTNAVITFNYTFQGLADGNLQSNINYNYNQSGNNYQGYFTDNTLSGPTHAGFVNGVASTALVFTSANLNVTSPTSTGTVSFVNHANAFAQFTSIFAGLLSLSPLGVGSATYAVSSIPLPAALPMFATLLAGLFGFSRRKRKALAA